MTVIGRIPAPTTPPDTKQPLTILHLIIGEPSHPTAANGVHNVARALIREQQAAGDRATLLMLCPQGTPRTTEADGPMQTLSANGTTLRGRMLRLSHSTIHQVVSEAEAAGLVHIHGGREPVLLRLCRTLRRRGIPYAVTIHGRYSHAYDAEGHRLKLSTALYLELCERPLLQHAQFVQALSPAEARVIRRIGPGATIKVIGNGTYSSRLNQNLPPPNPRLPSPAFPHFAYCGRYEIGHKGLDLLIEGFAHYWQRRRRGQLTLIGTGTARSELQQMATRLGVAHRVQVQGPKFAEERDTVLRQCDFFVMPSRFEGVPLAALEAASLGLPLIVSQGTGLLNQIQSRQAGLPIQSATAEAVATAMEQADDVSPSEWRARSNAAYHMALAIGDWTKIAQQLRDCYLQ